MVTLYTGVLDFEFEFDKMVRTAVSTGEVEQCWKKPQKTVFPICSC